MSDAIPEFYHDRDIARLLGMSPGWVRTQRYLRRLGRNHVLAIDPVQVGSSPRYRREDVEALIAALKRS
jgi:hypothetical protein